MDKQTNDKSSHTNAVHPKVLQVTGDETRRWCAAIWSVDPGEQRLIGGMRGLVESTLVAHWMQPPPQYEPETPAVNSFDLVFYQSPSESLQKQLVADGWNSVELRGMVVDEYEQFEVFVEEADAVGKSVSGRPDALWRCKIEAAETGGEFDWGELGTSVASMLDDQIWGQSPGWFSKAYCDELARHIDVDIRPDLESLARLGELILGDNTDSIRWIDSMAFQALCDFIGVVLEAQTPLEVQWGTCPVDEQTGLAPAPLLRVRRDGGSWERIAVGRDVLQRGSLPWFRDQAGVRALTDLVERYK